MMICSHPSSPTYVTFAACIATSQLSLRNNNFHITRERSLLSLRWDLGMRLRESLAVACV